MRILDFPLAALLAILLPALAVAQPADEASNSSAKSGEARTAKYQAGAIVKAVGGPVTGLKFFVPVPFDWDEQSVKIVAEELSPGAKTNGFQEFDGVRRLVVTVPRLAANEEARCVITYEIQRRMTPLPARPEQLRIPRKPNPKTAKFLLPSPLIESRDRAITELASAAVQGRETAWEQVAALFDLTRDKVEYETSELKGAIATLRDGRADCEGMTSLFIALCRANKIPARTVWVPGHCYAEFYLEDSAGNGVWTPCNLAGERPFPEPPDFRPILQKGDNFKVPENRLPQRYVQVAVLGNKSPGDGDPQVQWIGEVVKEE